MRRALPLLLCVWWLGCGDDLPSDSAATSRRPTATASLSSSTDFDAGCSDFPSVSIVLRDLLLRSPIAPEYVYDGC